MMRFLLISALIMAASLLGGMLTAAVLHMAGMPDPLIMITVVVGAAAVVLLDWRRNWRRSRAAEAADAEEGRS